MPQRFTALPRQLQRAARIRIGVAGKSQHEHGLHAGQLLLDKLLGESRVIAGDAVFVLRQRRVVRGGAEHDRAGRAVGSGDPEKRHRPIRGTARVHAENHAAVPRWLASAHHERDGAAAKGQFHWLQALQRLPDRRDDALLEELAIRAHAGDRLGGKAVPGHVALGDGRPGMGVRRVDQQLVARQAGPLHDALADWLGHAGAQADQIGGDPYGALAVAVDERQHLGVEVRHDAFGWMGASGVSRHRDRDFRRDLRGREPGLPLRGERGRMGENGGTDQRQDEARAHRDLDCGLL